jgi:hypothetical protein
LLAVKEKRKPKAFKEKAQEPGDKYDENERTRTFVNHRTKTRVTAASSECTSNEETI